MATTSPPPDNPTSTSPPPSLPPPLPLQSISPPRPKPLPSLWSHAETVHLISVYRQKWYSLNRGQLKASQWQDLSDSIPSKTATQCRHKIEKLRKRYRAEKNKPNPRAWEYFDLMHSLEHGPVTAIPIRNPNPLRIEIDEEEAASLVNFTKLNRKLSGFSESESEEEGEREGAGVVAREIRAVGERLVEVEKRKVEMMREMQRYRMEMEKRMTEMVLGSQRKILDTIGRAFGSHSKKMKMDVDDGI